MRYEITTFTEVMKRCGELIKANYAETGFKDEELKLDTDSYLIMDENTNSFGLIAYEGSKPVGYASILVFKLPHTSTRCAENDTIYVLPEYRSKGVGGRLFFMAEREAKARGATKFIWLAPVDSPLAKALYRRTPVDQLTFVRNL